MKNLVLVFVILFETIVFAKIPTTYFELQKELENPDFVFLTYDSETTNETHQLLGLKSVSTPPNEQNNSQPTLFRRIVTPSPQLEWESLKLDAIHNFDIEIKGLSVNERNSEEISVWVKEGIYFSDNGGNTFSFLRDETLKNENDFVEKSKGLENSTQFMPNKHTNKINNLPPMAPTVWDTILWDSTQTLLTNVVSSGALMRGLVTAGDSGYVHILTFKEDLKVRYFRSTDYGNTFEPEVILGDTVGDIYELIATGDYIYAYTIEAFFYPNPRIRLLVSPDKGDTWSVTKFPYGAQSTFGAVLDSAYDYQEVGASNPVIQAKSFDGGNSFLPYAVVTDTVYGAIQRPKPAIGGNSIIYIRHGNDFTLNGNYVYRSLDLGNTWLQPLIISPIPYSSNAPNITFHSNKFHITQGTGPIYYNRSEDFGNTFTQHLTICVSDSNCVSGGLYQQLSSNGENVFASWRDNLFQQGDQMMIRFSRDNGNNWSKQSILSKPIPNFEFIGSAISMNTNDSLIFAVYKPVNLNSWEQRLTFRRGFYRFAICETNTDSIEILPGIYPNQIDTSFVVSNSGSAVLEVTEIDLPAFITLKNLSDSTFVLKPDSSKKVNFTLDLTSIQNDTIWIYSNDKLKDFKTIKIINYLGLEVNEEKTVSKTFKLSQNYPNPFNPETVINYELGITNYEKASLTIFNVLGKEVRKWILRESDNNKVIWNGTDTFGNPVSSGVYLYQLKVGKFNETKKMVLLR